MTNTILNMNKTYFLKKNILLILFLIVVEFSLVFFREFYYQNLMAISSWLFAINFSYAAFSINFTFFGTEFSKYKILKNDIKPRQWFNIWLCLVLPLLLPVIYLVNVKYFHFFSLWLLPVVLFSSLDNAWSTWKELNPREYIARSFSNEIFGSYLQKLFTQIEIEVKEFESYIKNEKSDASPFSTFKFSPTSIGLKNEDIWDKLIELLNTARTNQDHITFTKTFNKILELAELSFSTKLGSNDQYNERSGLGTISRKRIQSIVISTYKDDSGGLFTEVISTVLIKEMMSDKCRKNPLSDYSSLASSNLFWLSSRHLEDHSESLPLNVLRCFHSFAELSIKKIKEGNSDMAVVDEHNISSYALYIKSLCQKAIEVREEHFIYRCIEALGFLGCNSAKQDSVPTTLACLESLAQIGRETRANSLNCFDRKCIIPFHSHAEENIGHIATWAVGNNSNAIIFGGIIQAVSRLRGVVCKVDPQKGGNPVFWISEEVKGDKKVPHIESLGGIYGYTGKIDYSDLNNLAEYKLEGFMGEKFYTTPVPIS